MTSRDFCYWLQGYFEIAGAGGTLSARQADIIRNHLNMVFAHEIDLAFGDKNHVEKLHEIHERQEKTLAKLIDELDKPSDGSGRGAFPRFPSGGEAKINC